MQIKRKSPKLESTKTIYSFETFDTFCDFCNFLENSTYKNEISGLAATSDLYEYNSNYYLIFTSINLNANISKFLCPTITEFAHFVDNSELFERKITEYGAPILKGNAIIDTINHFSKKKSISK